jgi:hypothetical protein
MDTPSKVGGLIRDIADDVKTIAKDEVELAKIEVSRGVRAAALDAAAIVLAGVVALIGLGMLCVAAVVALEPVIAPLWLRLVIMAVIYLAAGGSVAGVFVKRLRDDVPRLEHTRTEAARTVKTIREELTHA